MTKEEQKKLAQAFNEKKWSERYIVTIYAKEKYVLREKDEPQIYQVNWSAIGTVDVSEIDKMIAQLTEAKNLVIKLNDGVTE
jgi:hypothetical protein